MKFTLEEIRMASMLIFPKDFSELYTEFFGYPPLCFSEKNLWWFIKEYGDNEEDLKCAEYMVSKVLAKNLL